MIEDTIRDHDDVQSVVVETLKGATSYTITLASFPHQRHCLVVPDSPLGEYEREWLRYILSMMPMHAEEYDALEKYQRIEYGFKHNIRMAQADE